MEFDFKQLSLDQMSLLDMRKEDSMEKQQSSLINLIVESVGLTAEQAKQLSIENLVSFQEIILDINGFGEDNKLDKFKKYGVKKR